MSQLSYNLNVLPESGPLSNELEIANYSATHVIADYSAGDLTRKLKDSNVYINDMQTRQDELRSALQEARDKYDQRVFESDRHNVSPDILEEWTAVTHESLVNPQTHIPVGLIENIFNASIEDAPEVEQAYFDVEATRYAHNEVAITWHAEGSALRAIIAERDKLNRPFRMTYVTTGTIGIAGAAGGLTGMISNKADVEQLRQETAAEATAREHIDQVSAIVGLSGVTLALTAAVVSTYRNRYARNVAQKLINRR